MKARYRYRIGGDRRRMFPSIPCGMARTTLVLILAFTAGPLQAGCDGAALAVWIEDFRPRAVASGVSADTYDGTMRTATYDGDVVRRDRNQSEFTKPVWTYLDTAISQARVVNGRTALARQVSTLADIEARYGVESEVITAIWGLESAYGTFRGSSPIVSSLASLACDGRRGAFFEGEMIAAMRIVEAGEVAADRMTGSWAGAMGHTQFMPTSYLAHAVDHDGDGRRDIWSDDPADALASAAAYLAAYGWTPGQPWGVEVALPEGFDWLSADRLVTRLPSEWAAAGVMAIDRHAFTDSHGPASILLPAGARGAAFMIFGNFAVLERYNTADAYVIAVGHLADRIVGGGPIRAAWPTGDRALTLDERLELQSRLTAIGFDTHGIDGRIGPLTVAAVRAYQADIGAVPDGYAPPALLRRLRDGAD